MEDKRPELLTIPEDLPAPVDDGAADHLVGMRLPDFALESTRGRRVNLADEKSGVLVIYCYPRTGRPDQPIPDAWNAIPGARGCTPQNCSFRDHYAELQSLGAAVFGLSTQTPAYQREMAERVGLPFEVLSDQELRFTRALQSLASTSRKPVRSVSPPATRRLPPRLTSFRGASRTRAPGWRCAPPGCSTSSWPERAARSAW